MTIANPKYADPSNGYALSPVSSKLVLKQPADLTKTNEDFAILFPSVSSIYVKFLSQPDKLVPEGRMPAGLQHGAESLNFLNKDKGLFTYKYSLYSAGHSEWNLDKSDITESMIQKRDRKNTVVMGDSGGYQVATGVIKLPWAKDTAGRGIIDWAQDKKDTRMSILRWLEHTADLSMILDLPTAAIARGHVASFDDCLRNTLDNMDFFVKNREMEKTRFLNILQGIREDDADFWWSKVKDYPFEGWAMGGENASNFYFILKRMIEMRDGKYFEQHHDSWHPRNWIHFLGVSRLEHACTFTALQRVLRDKIDPKITISMDSASAFKSVAHGQIYTGYSVRTNRFSYSMDKGLDNKKYKGSNAVFPWRQTAIGQSLKVGDLCVRGEGDTMKNGGEASTSWDSFSYVLYMAHCAELQIQGVQEANRLFTADRNDTHKWIPRDLYKFDDMIKQIFISENPMSIINKERKFLEDVSGKRMGKGTTDNELIEMIEKSDIEIELDGTIVNNGDGVPALDLFKFS
jgi:hypothetical protein